MLILMNMLFFMCKRPESSPFDGLPAFASLMVDPRKVPQKVQLIHQVSVSQILVTYRGANNNYAKANSLKYSDARLRAEALLRLARSPNYDFAELAKNFSNDANTASQGGDLGVVSVGELHLDLEKAAWALDIGQVSDIIETPEGFHLLYRHEPSEASAAEIIIAMTAQSDTLHVNRAQKQRRQNLPIRFTPNLSKVLILRS